jgi:cyclic pyranopterin phosphate synthase
MSKLTHVSDKGEAQMVDVTAKPVTTRVAVAEGFITLQPATLEAIAQGTAPKGEVLNTARIAGILAAKRTGELIPMCHPLGLEHVEIDFELPPPSQSAARIRIEATAKVTAKTGIEMEALTAVSVAALTIYDMCKAIDKRMTIDGVRLVSKTGGTSSQPGASDT